MKRMRSLKLIGPAVRAALFVVGSILVGALLNRSCSMMNTSSDADFLIGTGLTIAGILAFLWLAQVTFNYFLSQIQAASGQTNQDSEPGQPEL